MAKEKRKSLQQQFLDIFKNLTYCRSSWDVWEDFLSVSAISIANCVPGCFREDREQKYKNVINRYKEEEQEKLESLFGIVIQALDDNSEQDFLGKMYHALRLEQHQKGQYFTPYHVCEFMAKIQFCPEDEIKKEIKESGFISVSDPACGAGVMLIAFANEARLHGINYQREVYFEAQDIDQAAVMMCFIQLALLGCPAVVIHGDSLAKPGLHPDNDVWYTPMYYINAWRFCRTQQEPGEPSDTLENEVQEDACQKKVS